MNPSSAPMPLKPLTAGGIVSVGFNLYRDRVRQYLRLAALADRTYPADGSPTNPA